MLTCENFKFQFYKKIILILKRNNLESYSNILKLNRFNSQNYNFRKFGYYEIIR